MKKTTQTLILLILVLAVAFGMYWYFFMNKSSSSSSTTTSGSSSSGFTPFGRTPTSTNLPTPTGNTTTTTTPTTATNAPIPTLRMLSDTPIGGYGSSVTGSSTVVRWIDRGRGNIYEATENSLDIKTLSNTVLPRMYTSIWNKDLTSFIGTLFRDGSEIPSTVYAALVAQKVPTASTSLISNVTPYALKGSALPDNIIGYAESPKKDKIFILINNGNGATGYTASTNGGGMTQIFTTPLTQVNVDWPADNIIAINTKGTSDEGGYLYFVNPSTGAWTKILGPLPGISAKVSHDGKYVLVSAAGANDNVVTSIYNVQKAAGNDALIQTIADKCTWGNFYKNLVYCGVPSQQVSGTYPDDWYKGYISFTDKIWQINADTGELHLISSIVDQSDRIIDAINLNLDSKDNYLFFMNKRDLSFWSLDLVKQ